MPSSVRCPLHDEHHADPHPRRDRRPHDLRRPADRPRPQHLRRRSRAALTAIATGILVFLFWDVVSHGVEPVESAPRGAPLGRRSSATRRCSALGFALGLMSLVYYDGWLKSKRATPLVGPGAAAVDEFEHRSWFETLTPGPPARAPDRHRHRPAQLRRRASRSASPPPPARSALALVLIIGFGLHNATEGFGIVGPMSGEAELPSWRFLGLMGLIGGGPTFLGTLIGQVWVSPALEVVFFALAGGSILYVVIQLFDVCRRFGDAGARRLDAPARARCSASAPTSCSSPPGLSAPELPCRGPLLPRGRASSATSSRRCGGSSSRSRSRCHLVAALPRAAPGARSSAPRTPSDRLKFRTRSAPTSPASASTRSRRRAAATSSSSTWSSTGSRTRATRRSRRRSSPRRCSTSSSPAR